MDFRPLFSTPAGMQILEKAKNFTRAGGGQVPPEPILHKVLSTIAANVLEFDKSCQFNVEWIGEETLHRLGDLGPATDSDDMEMVQALIYRFVCEFDLSVKDRLALEFELFIKRVRANLSQYKDEPRSQVEYARQDMAVGIVKSIVNADEFGNFRNIPSYTAQVENKIKNWDETLRATQDKATQLGAVLERHTQAFNFLGLHEGFSDLAKDIKKELKAAQIGMGVFGVLVLGPALTELFLVLSNTIDPSKIAISALIAVGLATVATTLLLLYFFRIALRKADACRAQLIQVRLRMSLCRFIQSYADYSSEFKSKNEGALAKFENLIFSGIVSSDEKLPSSFDGIEQLASLAKSVTGKS